MEFYSLCTTTLRDTDKLQLLSNATICQLRSATSQYLAWDLMFSKPCSAYFDQQSRLICQPCRATDGIGCSLFASGIAARIGENVHPSLALLDRHIRSLEADLEDQYLSAKTSRTRRRSALGGLVTLLLWLGWLRSLKSFTLCLKDFKVIEPIDGPTADLPRGCGVVGLRLGPETKFSRTKLVDLSIAYQTLSGYCCGKWFHSARRSCGIGAGYQGCAATVFTHPLGAPWTLYFYWHEFPSQAPARCGGSYVGRFRWHSWQHS
jgi:hypothetical protein